MLDNNRREALLRDIIKVWNLMDGGLKPEQIAVILDMDISTVEMLMDDLKDIQLIISDSGKSVDFILDQYGLSKGIKI